jgi:protocatechuate 3,4-dioxygenase alpha subunit
VTDDARDLIATPSQTIGPFFHFGLTTDPTLGCLAGTGTIGERMSLCVRVVDGDDVAVADALVEIWQADSSGRAAAPRSPAGAAPFSGFGRLSTNQDGSCEFETVRPGRLPDGRGGLQAPHINVCLFARGLLRQVHTRLYFTGDPALAEDAALGLVPESRRHTLLARPDPNSPGRWLFDIRLQGDAETVFFDV